MYTLFNAVDEASEDVVGEGDLHLGEVLAAVVAIGQGEGDRLAALRALADL